MIDQPDTDVDRILAAIKWPKDEETYGQIMGIVTVLGCGVIFPAAPYEVFAEVAQAIRDAEGIEPDNRRRYLYQISSRPRDRVARPFVMELNEQIGARRILRLCELIYKGGLTPTEARPWLEQPDVPWLLVERLMFSIFERRHPDDPPLPDHLVRWVVSYRDEHPFRSLFEGVKVPRSLFVGSHVIKQ